MSRYLFFLFFFFSICPFFSKKYWHHWTGVEFSRCLVEATLKNRSQPLALYCHNTDENEKLIQRHFKHPNLRISFKPLEPENVDWGMVRLHLKPLDRSWIP
ncbi:uncharacterized protein LOC117563495 [Drosophila albomicans]|uniref:Uncharacterized protein LOC117563495 n=1 Tax=Drosophila albomicans TaxID=7291 RepID=A0A6P8WJ87_DROAB|nr:uncharacterized protein LOC117563495 [Drosophila albomicans]